jgi:hypothetical protein
VYASLPPPRIVPVMVTAQKKKAGRNPLDAHCAFG